MAEKFINEQNTRFLMEHAPASIAMVDNEMRYLIVSKRFLEDYKLGNQNIIGRSHYELFPHLDESMKANHRLVLSGKTIMNDEVKFILPNGDSEWFKYEICPWVLPNNEIGGLVFFSEKITKRKEAQIALKELNQNLEKKVAEKTKELNKLLDSEKELNELKSKFVSMASHEIRTPMNAIIGFTNLLQRKNLDDESKEYVSTIKKSGESLLSVINDILDLSKIDAGMVQLESIAFSLRALLHSIEIMLLPKAIEKKLEFAAIVDEAVPDNIEGEATRLTQIFINLIGNALKFTHQGKVSVSITNQGIINGIIKIGITVMDTGIGIAQDKLPHIFERFKQAEDYVTRKFGGTGLGLSIVKNLVLLLNGTIEVQSKLGKGTIFTLVLPYKISSKKLNLFLPRQNKFTSAAAFENTTVLVVEDNEINQSLIKHLFKHWQLQFDIAGNGEEAINKLQQKKYDLILMDIQMPQMDGYTATQHIRGQLKLTTPIVAMTAHALTGEREKCISYGMNDYISKPLHEEDLLEMITQYTLLNASIKTNIGVSIKDSDYKYINLQYMKEISGGNIDYEKTVTTQFIEAIPKDLQLLMKNWQDNHITNLRKLAHNMKTTASVMGLNKILQPYLDTLEYENLTEEKFLENFITLKQICDTSVIEAKKFINTL